jgi:hypothetical protein
MPGQYSLPACLLDLCTSEAYTRWLQRKAQAHVRRDRKRYGVETCSIAQYKKQIHDAVCAGGNVDYYTGLPLDWSLISKFDNDEAKSGKSKYLRRFADLPTVDHTADGQGRPCFVICSWRVNDAKNHLTENQFIELCKQVLDHVARRTSARAASGGD